MQSRLSRRMVGPGWLAVPASSLVVPGIAVLVGSLFLAWKPGIARSMVASPRALGLTLVVGAIVLGAGWLLPRFGRGGLATGLAQSVPVLLAFVVTVAPAFRSVTVDEAFPERIGAPSAAVAGPMAAIHGLADVTGVAVLHGIDHRASGRVLLVARGDGSSLIRLEVLDVEPGPDYQVYLVRGSAATRPGDGVRLGHLRGNRGNQNYPIPATGAVIRPVTVLIWCRAFAVPVAAATIQY